MEGGAPKRNKKTGINWLLTIGGSLILIGTFLAVYFLMQGETKINNNEVGPENTETITCEKKDFNYTFFQYDNANSKLTTMHAVFSDNRLDSISLSHILYYSNKDDAARSEAENHGAMNLRFQREGLGPDALGMKYSLVDDSMKMSLYANRAKINDLSAKYFFLSNTTTDAETDLNDYDLEYVLSIYRGLGFDCNVKSNKEDL